MLRDSSTVVGSPLRLTYLGTNAQFNVAGIVDAGGAEDNQVFVGLAEAQNLARCREKSALRN